MTDEEDCEHNKVMWKWSGNRGYIMHTRKNPTEDYKEEMNDKGNDYSGYTCFDCGEELNHLPDKEFKKDE